jgi:hypothetical protein
MKRLTLILLAVVTVISVKAQMQMPPGSPTFELKGTVGLAEVKVVYSRPSARKRKVFGRLVPFGEVWRTGANASTKISFSKDVKLEGNPVSAGDYALYSIPGENEWTIILSKNLNWWGSIGYDPADDVLRFNVPTKHPSSHYETFTVSFSDFTMNTAKLNMKWEKTKAVFTIENDAEGSVMAYIKEHLIDGNTAKDSDYFQAASFYFDGHKDDQKALVWSKKAIEISGDQKKYWEYHLKAKVLERLGYNEDATVAAKESMALAKAGNNPDYVRLNEQLLLRLKF